MQFTYKDIIEMNVFVVLLLLNFMNCSTVWLNIYRAYKWEEFDSIPWFDLNLCQIPTWLKFQRLNNGELNQIKFWSNLIRWLYWCRCCVSIKMWSIITYYLTITKQKHNTTFVTILFLFGLRWSIFWLHHFQLFQLSVFL